MDGLRPGDPRQVGRYRLLYRLGEGGMGRVFLGESPGGRQVAVKLIHPGHSADPHFRQRFAREIEAARRVGGFHTALVVDADANADPPWMVTAYIHGLSLHDAVIKRGPLGLDGLRGLGRGLAEGLAAIHDCGLVHRDLKPGNVILAEDGPRIIDFGIARALAADPMTSTNSVIGTYSYMSPEQVHGQPAGPASDIFSLGSTLVFAATGRPPFGDESIVTVGMRIANEPPDLTGVTADGEFRELLRQCLAKSPDDRPTLAEILAGLTELAPDDPPADLVHAADTGSGRPYPRTQTVDRVPPRAGMPPVDRRSHRAPPRRSRSPGRRRWPIVSTALVVLVAMLFGGAYLFYQVSQDQYYVTTSSAGQVVIYRGISRHIPGFSLSSPYEETGIELAQVPSNYQQTVKTAGDSGSLTQVRATVTNIRIAVENCRNAYAALQNWTTAVDEYNVAVEVAHKQKKPTSNIPRPPAQPAPASATCPPSTAFGFPASALTPTPVGSS